MRSSKFKVQSSRDIDTIKGRKGRNPRRLGRTAEGGCPHIKTPGFFSKPKTEN
jgi:hypothetical protein